MPRKLKKLPKSKPGCVAKLKRQVEMLIRGKGYYKAKTQSSFGERLSMEGRMDRV